MLTLLQHDPLQHEPIVTLEITSEDTDWTAALTCTFEFEFFYDRFPAWSDVVQDYFEGYETGDVPATIDDALQLLRVLDAAYESGERGGWVEVAD